MTFGILDFGSVYPGSNAISTIHETLEMAQLAEELGFTRYWLSEHHEDGVAWKNPDILLPILAGYTESIKIGSAGVLVGLNVPINTAYHYKLLANLYPSRIDLGLAKGKTEAHKCIELVDGGDWEKNLNDFYPRIKKIKALINDEILDNILPPKMGESPNFWVLGTSKSSIDFVVAEQMHFSLSLFHNTQALPPSDVITELKEAYSNKHQMMPSVNIAITAFCSNDPKRIAEIKESTKNIYINFADSPDVFPDFLEEIAKTYDVDEIMINNLGQTLEEKLLLMNVFKAYIPASASF